MNCQAELPRSTANPDAFPEGTIRHVYTLE
jgi:hypothetical protein